MSHTPGPWRLSERGDEVQSGRNFWIARLYGGFADGGVQREANAHLIAAAPDLLSELKHLVQLMEPVEASGFAIPGLATLNAARAAIAKAEGR